MNLFHNFRLNNIFCVGFNSLFCAKKIMISVDKLATHSPYTELVQKEHLVNADAYGILVNHNHSMALNEEIMVMHRS